MKITIIEDEKLTADALEGMIRELDPKAEILAKIGSVEEAIEWLEGNRESDLIFCDIHLSDGNSFEIFNAVSIRCPVIFTTAYNQYAIQAFKVNSIDYLLKPLDPGQVAQALRKYESLYGKNQELPDLEKIHRLLQQNHTSSKGEKDYKSRFMVKIGDAIRSVATEEIAYFQVEEGIVVLTSFEGRRYLINYSLDQLEDQLDPTMFFRANRQVIVNIDAIKEIKPYFKGRLLLHLHPAVDEKVVVSSGKAPAFKEWLEM